MRRQIHNHKPYSVNLFILILSTFLLSQAFSFGPRRPSPKPPAEPKPEPIPKPDPQPKPTPEPTPDPTPAPRDPWVLKFSLVDYHTGRTIEGYESLRNGSTIDRSKLADRLVNIQAHTDPTEVGSVRLSLNSRTQTIDNVAPYRLFKSEHEARNFLQEAAQQQVAAIPYTEANEGGRRGKGISIRLTVQQNTQPSPEPRPDPTPTPEPPSHRPPNGDVPEEPRSKGTKVVTETIVISKSGTYDFKNRLHIWKGKSWNCTGDKENGPQILRIEANDVTIKNFHFVGDGKSHGSKGLGDPIHIASCGKGQGNLCPKNKPRRVVLDGIFGHACEDLITVGTPGTQDITVRNSYLKANPRQSSWDKTVQINFGKEVNFYDNIFVGGKFCLRYKPNTSGEVIGNEFYDCQRALMASSNDADISPMKDGPVTVRYVDNHCFDCYREVTTKGDKVRIIRK